RLLAEEAGHRAELFDQKREALVHCLKKLRDRDQELLQDRYARGMRGRKLAQKLDRTVDSILHSLHRIRSALRKCIERNLAMEDLI
ncbi:MAG: RNA polymerase subunit sigma, partial [Planctomycetota bacterium]|nr:RNA polymerase subunit sigma [Planctomycetota bacterium]